MTPNFCEERFIPILISTTANQSLRKSDSALRIRRPAYRPRRARHRVITFKGPRRKGRFKQRQEIQFGISDADIAEMFLAAIGYKKTLVYQKKRQVWRLGGCEVALDELPLLGTFVEIEGPSEKKIADVQKKLGLEDLPHIHRKLRGIDAKADPATRKEKQ